MRSKRAAATVLTVLMGLAACSRDPQVVKKRYFESGNKYFDKGRYKEASIQYRQAIRRDAKYGAAHYKLGLTYLKVNDFGQAAAELRRALDTIGPDSPDHWDAMVKLCELYLAAGRNEKTLMDDVETYTKELLKRDANSFDAHRLIGDMHYARALEASATHRADAVKEESQTAIAEYRKADSAKPGQPNVLMQLARALAADSQLAEAEKLYRTVIDKDKTFHFAYTELYKVYLFEAAQAGRAKDAAGVKAHRDQAEQILKLGYQNNPKQYAFLTLLAMHYYGDRRRDDMLAVLEKIKSHAKDYEQAYLNVGDFYLRMGDGDNAIKEFKEGIAKDPKKKAMYNLRIVDVMMRQGKRADAAQVVDEMLKDNPSDVDARGLKANFMLDKGEVAKALAELQSVVTQRPDNIVAHYNLGRAHFAMGEFEQARQQFTKAIELRPNYIVARLALAQLQMSRGEFDAAQKTALAILAADRANVQARLIESASLMGQKKYSDSRQILDSMIKGAPASTDVLFQLGLVNLAEKKYKDAEDAFRRAYQINPANTRGLMGEVETNMAEDKPDAAIALLRAESDKAPARVELHMAMGNVAVRAGKYDFAIQCYNKVLGLLDKNSKAQGDVYLHIGETYRRKGDLNSAVQALQKARESLPQNVVVLSELGVVLDGADRKPEAKQVYEATLKIQPDNAVVLNNLAFLLADNGGDLDDALTKAQRAKQMLPTLGEISDTLGWIYLKKNQPDDAISVFKELVTKQPNHSTYRYHLGMAYWKKGDKTRAMEQLREALKYNPQTEERKKIQEMIQRLC